ncbi:tRNA(Ile)-lysidine synthase [Mycoplasmopsis maculosa]|uniref:tRNA(Ile)-lysidine synthase n=1 Tax=Mycoplasmopsis maculosa TaxID=114885 RepID=A0A449B4T4_9BACT|nr:tRNA lysidine(34) synthetase TilS [Mycoplasmopsis maculosa]VEU75617.1 tRNA(Ile)-lysidine synthase [Mycoplasmopsis maculosa]
MKKLLGVSGGPDSMFLLNEFKNEEIIVATVNYNVRENSEKEAKIVQDFCNKNNIDFYLYTCEKDILVKNNFEDWARKIRFNFFKKIYIENNCNQLLLAHHKDDFIESCIMQENSKRLRFEFGIKEENYIYGMNIYRPFVKKYFKKEILEKVNKLKIPYAIDESNFKPIYERNKIRIELSSKTLEDKEKIFQKFETINIKNKEKYEKINNFLLFWKNEKYEQNFLINFDLKNEVIYQLLNSKYRDLNLTKGKINSIVDFILSKNRTNKYLLKNDTFLYKVKGKLLFK